MCHKARLSHLCLTLSRAYLILDLCWLAYTPVQRFIPNMCWMLWQMRMEAWHNRGKHRTGVMVSGKLTSGGGGWGGGMVGSVCVRPVIWSSKLSATWGEVGWRPGHVMRVTLCSPETPPSFTGQAKGQPCKRRNNLSSCATHAWKFHVFAQVHWEPWGEMKFCAAPSGWR